jgi:alginate O-acetyltransferase complex protein AlgI
VNLWIVFLCTGLWHGAAWTFVFFGVWHGLWLTLERLFLLRLLHRLPKLVSTLWTFFLFVLGCVLFNARDLATAGKFFREMFAFEIARKPWVDLHLALGNKFWFIMALAAAISFSAIIPAIGRWQERPLELPEKAWHTVAWSGAAVTLLVLSVSEIATMGFRPFIYYMF